MSQVHKPRMPDPPLFWTDTASVLTRAHNLFRSGKGKHILEIDAFEIRMGTAHDCPPKNQCVLRTQIGRSIGIKEVIWLEKKA